MFVFHPDSCVAITNFGGNDQLLTTGPGQLVRLTRRFFIQASGYLFVDIFITVVVL